MYIFVYMNAQVYIERLKGVIMQKAWVSSHSLSKHLPLCPLPGPDLLQAPGSQQYLHFDSQRQLRPRGAAGRRNGSWTWNTVQHPPPMSHLHFSDTLQFRKRKSRAGALEPWPHLLPRVSCVQALLGHTQPRCHVAMWGEWMEYRGQIAHRKWY